MRRATRKRTVYAANPLVDVVCQVRFPKNLAIEDRVPVEFQKSIGGDYPILETREGVQFAIVVGGSPEQLQPSHRSLIYQFANAERTKTIALSSDFISIGCHKYLNWEHFRADILVGLNALLACYDQQMFGRVGLRYQNLIHPEKLGIPPGEGLSLLNEALRGPAIDFETEVGEHQSVSVIKQPTGRIALRIAIGSDDEGPAYTIDCDVFLDQMVRANIDDTTKLLDTLHDQESELFRWATTDRLHVALGGAPGESG
jgi:uncharacterized protein (TIGR04255 family)